MVAGERRNNKVARRNASWAKRDERVLTLESCWRGALCNTIKNWTLEFFVLGFLCPVMENNRIEEGKLL